jgi:4-amino-4-deoxy-L-arabinose transferase-like glycosyltransferase
MIARLRDGAPLYLALGLFFLLAAYQLTLPGLHYDEAKEAGINAMQAVRGLPLSAFRGASIELFGRSWPLMVQDYIGALNVVLALPFLALGGVTVPALRLLSVACGLVTLVFLYLFARRWFSTRVAGATVLLLAVNPSFVFWSRQGIFVTNVTLTIFVASLWTLLRAGAAPAGRRRFSWLVITGFLWGMGLWAKLLFVWGIVAVVGVLIVIGVARGWRRGRPLLRATGNWRTSLAELGGLMLAMLAGAFPLLLYNVQTQGTLLSIFGNLGTSYYGVSNSAFVANGLARLEQVGILLAGNHLWYLGEVYINPLAAWALLVLLGAVALLSFQLYLPLPTVQTPPASAEGVPPPPWLAAALPYAPAEIRHLLAVLLLLVLMIVQSSFTVSGLFITHFYLMLPFFPLLGAAAASIIARHGRTPAILALAVLLVWGAGDLWNTLRYHQVLAVSGGYAAHADTSYRLAEYLETAQITSPLVLDWGIDAPLVYLSQGRVAPIEAFGYDRIDQPDAGFAGRLAPFVADPTQVFLLHTPEFTVFQGRREALQQLAAAAGRQVVVVATFGERSGRPLIELVRLEPD